MIAFFVPGVARAKGSPRVIVKDRNKRWLKSPRVVHDTPASKKWATTVAQAATIAMQASDIDGMLPDDVALAVDLVFVRAHLSTNTRNAKAVGRRMPHTKPDIDKLTRNVLDAMQGIVYAEDSRIVNVSCAKIYGGDEGVYILVQEACTDLADIFESWVADIAAYIPAGQLGALEADG